MSDGVAKSVNVRVRGYTSSFDMNHVQKCACLLAPYYVPIVFFKPLNRTVSSFIYGSRDNLTGTGFLSIPMFLGICQIIPVMFVCIVYPVYGCLCMYICLR